tara:strand:- start:1637 stop:2290 length:654 start_codon:yes stop_codon:yes gene_type:complete
MATYAALQQDVIDLVNRSDCTTTLAQQFLQQAQRKIMRTLRLPALEQRQQIVVGTTTNFIYDSTSGIYFIPSDFIQLVYIYDDDNMLERVPLRDFLAKEARFGVTGKPRFYTRIQNGFQLTPKPQSGHVFNVIYYMDDQALVNSTDTNVLSTVCPDLFAYAAALYACDYFNDKRKAVFEDMFNKLHIEVQALADASDEATVDAAVQPSFQYENDLLN